MNKRSAKVTRRGYLGVVLATLLWLPSLAQAVGLTLAVDKAGADVTTPITYTVDISCPSTEGTCTDAVVSVPLHTSVEYIGASNAVGNVQSIAYNASTHSVTITMNPTLNGTTDQVQLIVAFKGTTYTGTIANTTAYGAPTLQNPSNTVSTTATNGYAPPAFADRIDIGKSSGGINSTVMQGGYVQYRMSWSSKSQNEAINNLVLEDVLPANFNLTETYYNFYKASASAASIKTNLSVHDNFPNQRSSAVT